MKFLVGGLIAVIVGFIVTSDWESPQEKQTMAYMRGQQVTLDYARETCKQNIKNRLSVDVGYPRESKVNPLATEATLTWQGEGKEFSSIICEYDKDKGVTSINIDGVEQLGSEVAPPVSESANASKPQQPAAAAAGQAEPVKGTQIPELE